MFGLIIYYCSVFARAIRDTGRLANRQGVAVSLATAVISAVIGGFTYPEIGERFNVAVAIYLALAGAALVTIVFFLWNLTWAPYRLAQEQSARAVTAEHECAQRVERLVGELRAAKAQLDERERRKAIRERLGKLLRDGERLLKEINGRPAAPTVEVQDWIWAAEACLKAEFDTSYVARFYSDAGLLFYGLARPQSYQHGATWQLLNNRLTRIKEFIAELSTP